MATTDNSCIWAILEIIDYKAVAGLVRHDTLWGAPVIRVDIFTEAGCVSRYFGGSFFYRINFADEETVRKFVDGKTVATNPPDAKYDGDFDTHSFRNVPRSTVKTKLNSGNVPSGFPECNVWELAYLTVNHEEF